MHAGRQGHVPATARTAQALGVLHCRTRLCSATGTAVCEGLQGRGVHHARNTQHTYAVGAHMGVGGACVPVRHAVYCTCLDLGGGGRWMPSFTPGLLTQSGVASRGTLTQAHLE